MTDRIFLQLNDKWALAADQRQWVLLTAEKRGLQAQKRHRRSPWRAEAFIASSKAILLRVVAEKGIEPTPEAQAALYGLPATFRAWLRRHNRRGGSMPERVAA
jgi:hypothetical protein